MPPWRPPTGSFHPIGSNGRGPVEADYSHEPNSRRWLVFGLLARAMHLSGSRQTVRRSEPRERREPNPSGRSHEPPSRDSRSLTLRTPRRPRPAREATPGIEQTESGQRPPPAEESNLLRKERANWKPEPGWDTGDRTVRHCPREWSRDLGREPRRGSKPKEGTENPEVATHFRIRLDSSVEQDPEVGRFRAQSARDGR